ncbi:NADH-dependent flavin oxidoreductase [Microbotryomycetes sp. JL201]|nr:NADH-dependent flavin oxidoreductase [Microbotryomycetes sp. JL201]
MPIDPKYQSPAQARVPDSDVFYPLAKPSPGTLLPKDQFTQNDNAPKLFTPIRIGGQEFKNRIFVAPMCQYSSDNGMPTPWHLVHLGTMAARGAAVVMMEATSVLPNGRISPEDSGIWSDEHRDAMKPIFSFIKAQGAKAAIQLAHAGRKASTVAPWVNYNLLGNNAPKNIATVGQGNGWSDVWAPSPISFKDDDYPDPVEMTLEDIETFKKAWRDAVKRADEAGVDLVECHCAHGYLLHEFLSPLSNKRTDKYGGSLENRMRLALEIVDITRETLSPEKQVWVRISATDHHEHGEKDADGNWISWGIEQSKMLTKELAKHGVVLVDASSGGLDVHQKIKVGPGYQVPLAQALKESLSPEDNITISSVGLITSGKQAEEILQAGASDVVTVAREFLRHADLVFDWAQELGVAVNVPVQYQRAHTRMIHKQ